MKNKFLIAIAALLIAACQPSSYTITGAIEGVEGKVFLHNLVNGRPSPVDTAEIVDGKFTFTGTIEEPQLYLIFAENNNNPIVFFGENANIEIKGEAETFHNAVVSGSKITDVYNNFTKEMPGKERINEINREFQQASTSGNTEMQQALRTEATELMEEQKAYFINFIKTNTNSIVSAYMAIQAAGEFELEEFKTLIAELEENIGTSQYINELKEILTAREKTEASQQATKIGAIAPDFTLESVDGKKVALSSLKGKYLFVDFWASWCRPCREENPNVVKAYNKYAEKGFDVLSVSLDKDSAAWKKAIADDKLTWTQLIDATGDVATTYGITGIPHTLLLDKEGKIIAKNLRGNALEEKLKEIFE